MKVFYFGLFEWYPKYNVDCATRDIKMSIHQHWLFANNVWGLVPLGIAQVRHSNETAVWHSGMIKYNAFHIKKHIF